MRSEANCICTVGGPANALSSYTCFELILENVLFFSPANLSFSLRNTRGKHKCEFDQGEMNWHVMCSWNTSWLEDAWFCQGSLQSSRQVSIFAQKHFCYCFFLPWPRSLVVWALPKADVLVGIGSHCRASNALVRWLFSTCITEIRILRKNFQWTVQSQNLGFFPEFCTVDIFPSIHCLCIVSVR